MNTEKLIQRSCAAFVLALLITLPAFGEGTRTWKQSSFEEFEKGTAKGVAIRSDGTLELAPAFQAIYTTPSTYIWSVAGDGEGNVYAAAGSPARVYRVTPEGKATVIFEPQELQVQALVVDSRGVLFAATSPDGKVYKIERKQGAKSGPETQTAKTPSSEGSAKSGTALDPSFASSVFFDPKSKYIWDLVLDSEGQLYVATGDHGEIFRVSRSGEGLLFFKSDEAHIRVLAFDRKGNLIAGSDGSGLVYRISLSGEAFVLYSAPKKEITALAINQAGSIYAAGVGEKRVPTGVISLPPAQTVTPQPQVTVQQSGVVATAPQVAPAPPPPITPLPALAAGPGSEVYQITPDGTPRRIWASREDIVYALSFDERGRLLAGTGNKGRIYVIEGEGDFTDLLKASASQVTAFAKSPKGGLCASTSNLGKLFLMQAAPSAEGTYESDVFDARIFSRWGRAEVLGSGTFDFYARSGNVDNPDRNWSPWKQVDFAGGAETGVPSARFIQWKVVLRPGEHPPQIDSVLLNYRPNNVAPVIDDVIVQTGVRYQSLPKPTGEPATGGTAGGPPGQPRFEAPPPTIHDRQSIGVRWVAHDDNDDELVYSVYYRGDAETRWKLLKDKISDKFYSWDAGLFPDGGYTVKVVASDAPSHSPDEALTGEKQSARFEVDTTPPRIEDLSAVMQGERIHITLRATDSFSPIKRAEYSIDAGDWHFVEPVGQLSDSRVEHYDFSVPSPGGGGSNAEAAARKDTVKGKESSGPGFEHVIVVRVYDRFDNMGSAKTVLRGK